MFKEVDDFYAIKAGQTIRISSPEGDGVFTGTVQQPETNMDHAKAGGVSLYPDFRFGKVEVEDPPAVLPTTLGSVVKIDVDDDGYLVLNEDGWGNPDYWYEEYEYGQIVEKGFTVIYVNKETE